MTAKPKIPLSRLRELHRMARANFVNWGGDSVSATFRGYVGAEVQRLAIVRLVARLAALQAEKEQRCITDLEAQAAPPKSIHDTLLAALTVYEQECGKASAIDGARAWVRSLAHPEGSR